MTVTFTMPKHFSLGLMVITPNAAQELHPLDVRDAIQRHARGDWGELDPQDHAMNETALVDGGRLFSVYRDRNQKRFYIITEADHSVTTCLLPEDY